ncbi:MAG: SDR family NAD(P)-dependent oxidoreductase [Pseudomonadales bacterium]
MTDYPTPYFSNDLSGDVAFITGTTSGLGRRFAKVLAACGAKVAVTGRRVEKLESLVSEIQADGGTALAIPMDMTSRDDIRNAVETAEKELGPISILVNNAGIPDAQWALKMDDELIDNVFDTNLTGPWFLSLAVGKKMVENKIKGRMVNIASVAAFNTTGQSASSLYSVTKSAVVRMTEALAVEWSRFHINVNCIAPGAFSSEMMDGMLERMGDISKMFPRGRICDPAQMDSTLLFLVSPSSECVTGTVIKIDDGQGSR